MEQVKESHEVSYINTRVVGPTPYLGDQVALFTGLFRVRTKSWAVQALDLLQSVATTFDSSKLTKYINISEPLMSGVEGFLGMEDMELRLAQRIEYTDSTIANINKFQPGYWVMIRSKNEVKKEDIYVKDNKLMILDKHGQLKEYNNNDYIIYSVEKLTKRYDYSEFDFHKIVKKIKEAIWDGNSKKSKDLFHSLFYSISVNEDLTQIQKNELQLFYQDLVKNEILKYKEQKNKDSMFDFGDDSDTNESANKYALTIKKIAAYSQTELSLDDLTEEKNKDVINQNINDYLNSEKFKSIDVSNLDSKILAGRLYEEILKL